VRGDHLLIAPPYIVTEPELDTIVQTLREAIQDSDPKGFPQPLGSVRHKKTSES